MINTNVPEIIDYHLLARIRHIDQAQHRFNGKHDMCLRKLQELKDCALVRSRVHHIIQ